MKILFASDSFKGSLTSGRIAELLEEVSQQIFPGAQTQGLLVADGGEGTMEALVSQLGGSYRTVTVPGPLGEPVAAKYGMLGEGKAIVEMAQASGLPLIPREKLDPVKASSYGTGLLIKDALDRGAREIVMALGGSGTNDGGMGMLAALGVKFLDSQGKELAGCGGDLGIVDRIDFSGLEPALKETTFTVICDVVNPLLGEQGATHTFGPQKGADPSAVEFLEKGMSHYARLVEETMDVSTSQIPGAGAAGGMAFALLSFFKATLKPGIDTVLDLLEFDRLVADADLVITGEGRMDWQSSYGKVPSGVGERCKKASVPAVAIVGGLLDGYQEIYQHGICSVVTTVNGIMPLEQAIEESESLYRDAAYRLFGAIRCGTWI